MLSGVFCRYAMTLLPAAAGTASQPLYWSLVQDSQDSAFSLQPSDRVPVQVCAINFGIKHMLFDHYLRRDMAWFCLAVVLLLLLMWFYSTSLFLVFVAAVNIFFAMEISYFMYTYIMKIHFFPFMNLLALVILVGIGFDDMFIYCKVWALAKLEKNAGTLEKIISDSLRHAVLSMLVSSFTTGGAFYASAVSNITALKCFSIFAGTAVMVNFVLMITFVPAAMVVYEKWCCECVSCCDAYRLAAKAPLCGNCVCQLSVSLYYTAVEWSRIVFEKLLPCVVVRLRYVWLVVFGGVAVCGIVVVFYRPRLRLPSSNEFQVSFVNHVQTLGKKHDKPNVTKVHSSSFAAACSIQPAVVFNSSIQA